MSAVRVAVIDIGTNSTRLLIADVEGGRVREVDRRSTVTRLGQGVDATGALAGEAMARVHRVLDEYAAAMAAAGVQRDIGVLTSAVRDATNGPAFLAAVRDRHGLDARTLSGDEEAGLTFLGASSERDTTEPTLVIDIGGGSTEMIVGIGRTAGWHVSTQVGVVRHSERHLHHDPPPRAELDALRDDARAAFASATEGRHAAAAVAVAGTATSLAAIELALDPYDSVAVEGHRLTAATILGLRDRLAALTNDERRAVTGLHPDRAPTIVAGTIVLIEILRAFGLPEVEVSEHDILRGAALSLATSVHERTSSQ